MAKRLLAAAAALLMGAGLTGCAYVPGGTDLSEVASAAQLRNVTTGDGTFENYTATGHYTGTEVGIGVGIPGVGKIMELMPAATNEALLGSVARAAKADGADALINVKPSKSTYTGIPFVILGVYVDRSSGTGIRGGQAR